MEIVNVIYSGTGKVEQDYSIKDKNLIPNNFINNSFGDPEDVIEFIVYDVNENLLNINYRFEDYTPYQTINPETGTFNQVLIDPLQNLKSIGYNRGSFNTQYNFLKNLFNSSNLNRYWIKEISPSRTELKLSSQTINSTSIQSGLDQYQAYISLKNYYSDFYLNFGNNEYIIATNAATTIEEDETVLLIKLYEPLPFDYDLKTQLWIVDKLSDSVSYNVEIQVESEETADFNSLRGPNYNVRINEKNAQTTPYYTYASLLESPITSSYRQLASYYQDKAISINVDFTNFENFVHFSSATERVNNFVYKLNLIEDYNTQIVSQSAIIGNSEVKGESITVLEKAVSNIIENFDIYEYYLYYNSASFTWPKSNSTVPYSNVSVTSSAALDWLGSENTPPTNTSASILYSASLYDNTNKDILRAAIPQYIYDDESNQPYVTFVDMIGQHFDNIWVYYKDVTNRYNATNNPNSGVSMDLVSDAIQSMGMDLYTNTNVSDNLYYDLFGYNYSGGLLPPTGSEIITNYVTSSLATEGSKQLQQEIYKRIYHNLPYLFKTRGTQRSIKALISIYGIPEDILTINEFGAYSRYTVDGIDAINNDKIDIFTSNLQLSSSLLSKDATLQYYSNDYRPSSTNIEVGFSIADVINREITGSLGYFNIDNLIGNPTDQYLSSYQSLVSASNAFFDTNYGTTKYSVSQYIRLIKYFNNSLFKTIKDFVPARANLSTGIIVKSHMLERNKYARHEPSASFQDYSQSIDMIEIDAVPGNIISGSTAWSDTLLTIVGEVPYSSSQNVEKLTGEFDGTEIVVTNGLALDQTDYSNDASGSIANSDIVNVNYGALYQNVSMSVRSTKYFDLDYNFDQLTPTNFNLITKSMQEAQTNNYEAYTNPNNPYAYLQDTNYALRSFTDPRYYGSKVESSQYNVYTAGDTSYGKTAAIDKIKYQYAYLVDIYTASLFFPNRSNAQIKYLIDDNQNVLDLTKANSNIFEVQNVFKSQQTCDIALFKYDEQNPYSQLLANNPTQLIYEGGFRYLPMLHNISGSSTITQSYSLNSPVEVIIQGGSTGSGATGENDPLNYVVGYHSCEIDYGSGYSEYSIFISASYIGGGNVTNNISIQVRTSLQPNGSCGSDSFYSIEIPVGQASELSSSPIVVIPSTTFGSSTGNGSGCSGPDASPASTHWPPFPPFSIPKNCSLSIVSVSGGGTGAGGTSFVSTILTTTVTGSTPCLYYLSESREVVFNSQLAFYYNNPITFDSTTDPSWSSSTLERVVIPFSLSTGDKISFYNESSLGWDERWEYTVKSSRVSGSGVTGSRLIAELDESVDGTLLTSGSGVPVDTLTGAEYRACRYVVWKHVPDETNVMLRFNPRDPKITEEGLLFPQYISETVKSNSGNTIKALRGQNLLPPSP